MDQYCILGRIGEGAHGIVFKAKHVEVRPRRVCSPRVPAALPSLRSFDVEICQRSGLGGVSRILGRVRSGAIPLPAAGLQERVP